MSGIKQVRITYWGGTDEEQRALTDAITYVLIEHGVKVAGMQTWDGDGPRPEEA